MSLGHAKPRHRCEKVKTRRASTRNKCFWISMEQFDAVHRNFDALPEFHQVLVACAVREAQLEAPEIHSTLDVRNEARDLWVLTLWSRGLGPNFAPWLGSTCQRDTESCTLCSRILSTMIHLCARCMCTSGACTLVAMMHWMTWSPDDAIWSAPVGMPNAI